MPLAQQQAAAVAAAAAAAWWRALPLARAPGVAAAAATWQLRCGAPWSPPAAAFATAPHGGPTNVIPDRQGPEATGGRSSEVESVRPVRDARLRRLIDDVFLVPGARVGPGRPSTFIEELLGGNNSASGRGSRIAAALRAPLAHPGC
jgi:hypothetical protein